MVRRANSPKGIQTMKRTAIAALGAAMIATLGTSSATHAAAINFDFTALNGSIVHDGTSLSDSTYLDLDDATELVLSAGGADDDSGLNSSDTITLTGATTPPLSNAIIYGSAPGPLGANVILTWPMAAPPGSDMFTETLTTVTSIKTSTDTGFINVVLTGTVSDTDGLFKNTPVTLNLTATQDGANLPSVAFSNTTMSGTPTIPEASTWAMMALGFAAIGYAGLRRRLNFGRMAGSVLLPFDD
jgi:hypothetical protein